MVEYRLGLIVPPAVDPARLGPALGDLTTLGERWFRFAAAGGVPGVAVVLPETSATAAAAAATSLIDEHDVAVVAVLATSETGEPATVTVSCEVTESLTREVRALLGDEGPRGSWPARAALDDFLRDFPAAGGTARSYEDWQVAAANRRVPDPPVPPAYRVARLGPTDRRTHPVPADELISGGAAAVVARRYHVELLVIRADGARRHGLPDAASLLLRLVTAPGFPWPVGPAPTDRRWRLTVVSTPLHTFATRAEPIAVFAGGFVYPEMTSLMVCDLRTIRHTRGTRIGLFPPAFAADPQARLLLTRRELGAIDLWQVEPGGAIAAAARISHGGSLLQSIRDPRTHPIALRGDRLAFDDPDGTVRVWQRGPSGWRENASIEGRGSRRGMSFLDGPPGLLTWNDELIDLHDPGLGTWQAGATLPGRSSVVADPVHRHAYAGTGERIEGFRVGEDTIVRIFTREIDASGALCCGTAGGRPVVLLADRPRSAIVALDGGTGVVLARLPVPADTTVTQLAATERDGRFLATVGPRIRLLTLVPPDDLD